MTTLQTSRLKLAPYREADIDGLYSIMKDGCVMQHIGNGAMSRAEVVDLVDRVEKRWQSIGMGWWTIRLKTSDQVLGQICLQPLKELAEIEVGYALGPTWWGKGLAEEALGEVLRYAAPLQASARGLAQAGVILSSADGAGTEVGRVARSRVGRRRFSADAKQ